MIRIGSRGSALARWQADHIATRLRQLGEEVSIEILVTTGDRVQNAPFLQVGTKGMFTREIEDALAEGRIDLAVHSLKDLPTKLDSTFVIAAIPERADPRDALVSMEGLSFSALPERAIVGTSSLRRQAQLRHLRADLDVRELRGNVDTRLRKLKEGHYDAIVLAAAGLDRLQQAVGCVGERFSMDTMCSAPGQGALAIECRANDNSMRKIVATLDHYATRFAVTAERSALETLEGGCHVPIGMYCGPMEHGWRMTGVVVHPDGSAILREHMDWNCDPSALHVAEEQGRQIALRLLDRGAANFLASIESSRTIESSPA